MKRIGYTITALIIVLSFFLLSGSAQGESLAERGASLETEKEPLAPLTAGFTYQGMLHLSGNPHTGTCDFIFTLYDAATGVGQVGSPSNQTLSVSDGLFIAPLDFGTSAFGGSRRWLEVQARCPTTSGTYVSLGRQELTAAPYSLYATSAGSVPWSGITSRPAGLDDGDDDVLGGLSCAVVGQIPKWNGSAWACAADDEGGFAWKNLKTVALSGAEYTAIQAAIDSISDEAANNPYLVMVGPGVYTETVTLKPFVHLIGAGQDATVIREKVDFVTTGSVVRMASDTSLRDLTVWNYGSNPGSHTNALSISSSSNVLVEDVTAKADGSGGEKSAVSADGAVTSAVLVHVTALAENDGVNFGLKIGMGAHIDIVEGLYQASSGQETYGVFLDDLSSLEAENATMRGKLASQINTGLLLYSGAKARLFGGLCEAEAGDNATAINLEESDLTADSIRARAFHAVSSSVGISAYSSSLLNTLTLRDSTIEVLNGDTAIGVNPYILTFISDGNVIRAEHGKSATYGVLTGTKSARMKGDRVDVFSQAGTAVIGILNEDNLDAREVIVTAEGHPAVPNVIGLYGLPISNSDLLGGVYSASLGGTAIGILNEGQLTAREVVALGMGGELNGGGLKCKSGCNVWGGSFTGSASAVGIGRGIWIEDALFDGRDFSATGSAGNFTYGLEVSPLVPPTQPPVFVQMAVLEGQVNSVWVMPAILGPTVNIGSSRLIGTVFGAPPAVFCTLTSRSGNPVATVNQGICP